MGDCPCAVSFCVHMEINFLRRNVQIISTHSIDIERRGEIDVRSVRNGTENENELRKGAIDVEWLYDVVFCITYKWEEKIVAIRMIERENEL